MTPSTYAHALRPIADNHDNMVARESSLILHERDEPNYHADATTDLMLRATLARITYGAR